MKRRKHTREFTIWNVMTIICFSFFAFFFLYPLLRMIIGGIYVDGKFNFDSYKKFFTSRYYMSAVANSFKIALTSTCISIVTGTTYAMIMRHVKIKGKKLIDVLLLVSTITPPFLGGYSWILLGGRVGYFTKFINKLFGIQFPGIYGFWGIIFTFVVGSTATMYMYISGALKNLDSSLVEAAENLGCRGLRKIIKIYIPLILPTVLSTALLSFMRAFADFGTAELIGEGYHVLGGLIYSSYLGEVYRDGAMASALSSITLAFTAIIFMIQRYFATRKNVEMNSLHPIEQKDYKGIKGILAHAYIYFMTTLSILPIITVTYNSFQKSAGQVFVDGQYSLDSYAKAFSRMGKAISRTYIFGFAALALILVIGIITSYANVRHRSAITKTVDTLTFFPFIVPGAVLGIATILAFNGKPFYLTGTSIIIIAIWVIRRLPYTIRSSTSVLHQIGASVEEASQSLGANGIHTFFKVTLPMMFAGILPGALLSWVSCITELSSSLFVYNNKNMTMSIAIYTQILKGNMGIASAMSTILLVSAATVLTILFTSSKGKMDFGL
ncbi:MAG: iron ABC transporter permease [Erysipelotrichaceae bacterium]|nr:iron ABC transporter permease [Erysipelotrichaceae bacterium]MBQ2685024.1 iron ABC transporter permease [Erysipelotrichaceae bacterium]